jgi:hypothetical protein
MAEQLPADAFAQLLRFHGVQPLTGMIAQLETQLSGGDDRAVLAASGQMGFTPALLEATLLVRRHVGRLSDLIHAAAITLALLRLLEDGEQLVNRPSLAAGNDPDRPYDVETDRCIAEFKVGVWSPSGSDAMRKRGVVHDLVHLAAAAPKGDRRRAELFVVGEKPLRFPSTSRSSIDWALNRGASSTRALFEEHFGSLTMKIRDFTAGVANHVALRDLTDVVPQLRDALIAPASLADQRPADPVRVHATIAAPDVGAGCDCHQER